MLGDTRPLWDAWLEDAARRLGFDAARMPADRVAAAERLDRVAGNWRALLERFSEERAAVHLRPNAEVSAALRRLQAAGVTLGAFTDAPEGLARVALAQLGATRRLTAFEAGPDALDRLRTRLGPEARVVRTREELLGLA